MGKTWLLNTIGSCHAAAVLPANVAESHGLTFTLDRGLIKGRSLRRDYTRIVVVHLRDLTGWLEGGMWPITTLPGATVEMAAALAVMRLFSATSVVANSHPSDVVSTLFGLDIAEHTLWLLDGFDEVPDARSLAAQLAPVLTAAYSEVRARKLSAPSATAAEREYCGQPATSIPRGGRLFAVLRILLSQPHVIISSRPQFEPDLTPFSGRANALFLRLQPLSRQAVRVFVKGALQVGVIGVLSAFGASLSLHPPDYFCHDPCSLSPLDWSELRRAWPTIPRCSKPCARQC